MRKELKKEIVELVVTGAAFVCLVALLLATSGCFTSATAVTEKRTPDGTYERSKVSIIGTGDKASEVATEGLTAEGGDVLGAGVANASSKQQSTGIDGTVNAISQIVGIVANAYSARLVSTGISPQGESVENAPALGSGGSAATLEADSSTAYSVEGYDGTPAADGSGVYGRPSCSRCRAYLVAHQGAVIIDIDQGGHRSAMWTALRSRGFTEASVTLPVVIGAAGYTIAAR